jgi:hypothetical protein
MKRRRIGEFFDCGAEGETPWSVDSIVSPE